MQKKTGVCLALSQLLSVLLFGSHLFGCGRSALSTRAHSQHTRVQNFENNHDNYLEWKTTLPAAQYTDRFGSLHADVTP